MKIARLTFLLSLFSVYSFAFQINGRISQMRPGAYRIMYPQQIIKVYFDYVPSNGLENVFAETDLSENERLEITRLIKEQIDQWPEEFVNNYLDVEIYPLVINNRDEFGYNLDNRIVIDVRKIKQGMSFKNSVKSSLAHQVAYLLKDNPQTREASSRIRNYINSIHLTYFDSDDNNGYSIYEEGYVSRYANGELSGNYAPEVEFAEIFAHLTCDENKSDLMDFLNSHPENILSIKVSRYIDYLTNNVSGFERNYFELADEPAYVTPTYDYMDGEMLLSIHELRSYQSLDFESMGDKEEPEPWIPEEEPEVFNEPIAAAWEKEDPEVEYEVYRNSKVETTYQREEQPPEQKSKKKKKKNGKGLLITGAAIYVLLQLLK